MTRGVFGSVAVSRLSLAIPIDARPSVCVRSRLPQKEIARAIHFGTGVGEEWRRIDQAGLAPAAGFALKLDSDTNNTSLALAFELGELGDANARVTARHATDGIYEYRQGHRAEDDTNEPDVEINDQGGGVGSVRPVGQKTGPAPARLLVRVIYQHAERNANRALSVRRYYYDRVA